MECAGGCQCFVVGGAGGVVGVGVVGVGVGVGVVDSSEVVAAEVGVPLGTVGIVRIGRVLAR